MTTKKLTPRQVRWTEFLSEFNFVISYQSGKKNNKADTLTRKPNKRLTKDEDKQHQHCMCVLLLSNRINHEAKLQLIEESEDDHAKNHANRANSNTRDKMSTLPEQVIEFNQNNELCSKICLYLANPKGLNKPDVYLKGLQVENGLLIKEN